MLKCAFHVYRNYLYPVHFTWVAGVDSTELPSGLIRLPEMPRLDVGLSFGIHRGFMTAV